ncbi:phage portal protein [Cryobacterium sp. Y62]|uniref:phage portal protein n=1 Tax=Cryobacterium sp. Y62 TaxID=2048284 RepID=UPI000CE56A27|nr:phage portal protein [Cryobacterium sp. Y62]
MSSIPVMAGVSMPNVKLDGSDHDLFVDLFTTWQQKRRRNLMRTVYDDGKAALKDFGIAVPPQMQRAFTPLQWISRGVNALTGRSQFEGFVSSSGADDPFGLAQVLDENDFVSEFQMAKRSSAVHACSFLTVSSGDVQAGEPDVLILPRAADASGATWDKRRRVLGGFLSVIDMDHQGPSEMVMYTWERVYLMVKSSSGWRTTFVEHSLGEVPVARLPHAPDLSRPFGHSRISRTAMGMTDAAVRTILRSEVSAEFYAADKYWLFGADVTKFVGDDKWSAVMGRMNAIDQEVGEEIKVQRFSGASPQPHIDQLRMLASQFADDQDLDVKWADASNPSSADAIYAAKEDLIMKTRDQNRVWGRGGVKAMQLAVRLRDGLDTVPDELRSLSGQFTDPAIVSPSARSNAFVQLASSITGFGESEVGLEFAGLTREQIVRFQAEKRRSGVTSLVESLRGAAGQTDPAVAVVAGQRGDGE